MKLSVRLRNVQRIFLDTRPIIYFVEKNPIYLAKVQPVFTRIDSSMLTAVTSPITLSECLVHHSWIRRAFPEWLLSTRGFRVA